MAQNLSFAFLLVSRLYVLKSNYQVIMLSYASKGRNHIAMMSNNSIELSYVVL